MTKIVVTGIFAIIFILIDIYVFQAVRLVFQQFNPFTRKLLYTLYWSLTGLSLTALIIYNFAIPQIVPRHFRSVIIVGLSINYFSKIFGALVLIFDDLLRIVKWIALQFQSGPAIEATKSGGISRSEFLAKTTLVAASLPMVTMTYGIVSGAHDYRVRKKTIHLPDLPDAFDGIRIGQISDIHSGSFFSRSGVRKGVDLLLAQSPDVIFFTGDLVNNQTDEVNSYVELFSKIKAPLGVFSTLGNHDYGDYRSWPSVDAKRKNLMDLINVHKHMGWNILLNENRRLRIEGEEIAIIGVENWGKGRFSKYGDLAKAYAGSEDAPVKLLLSHDPSHWDAQIRPDFPDIDVTFAGHTHGFQFGIEIGDFKWSPSQYIYDQWAGLYQKDLQYIYVNRGFGFLGYPGRIGILPEITIIELKKA